MINSKNYLSAILFNEDIKYQKTALRRIWNLAGISTSWIDNLLYYNTTWQDIKFKRGLAGS